MGRVCVALLFLAAVATSTEHDGPCDQDGDEDPVCLLQLRGGDKASGRLGVGSAASWVPKLDKQEIKDGTALCIDGSTPFYYLRKTQSKNWVIGLQGGGVCASEDDCKARSETPKGSSNTWKDVNLAHHLSLNVPAFADFNHVHVRYCSGDTWMGTHVADDRSWGLHFNGHNIFADVIADLLAYRGMDTAEVVVLTGSSAGALGAYHNAGYLYDQLHIADRNIHMMLAPEGMFQTAKFQDVVVPRVAQTEWGACALGHGEGHLDAMDVVLETRCTNALGDAAAQCLDAMVYMPYLLQVMPVMVIYNRYDVHPMEMELLMKLPEPDRTDGMKEWSAAVDAEFQTLLEGEHSDRLGFFVSSCFKHAQVADGAAIDGDDLGDVVGNWFSYQAAEMGLLDDTNTDIEPEDFQTKDDFAPVSCNPTCLSVNKKGLQMCKGDPKAPGYVEDTSKYCAAAHVAEVDPCEDVATLAAESATIQAACAGGKAATCDTECANAYKSSTMATCDIEEISDALQMDVETVEGYVGALSLC